MQLTFKPQINKNNHATLLFSSSFLFLIQVRSRLNLRNPDAYMKTVREQQEEKYRKEVQATQEREVNMFSFSAFRDSLSGSGTQALYVSSTDRIQSDPSKDASNAIVFAKDQKKHHSCLSFL